MTFFSASLFAVLLTGQLLPGQQPHTTLATRTAFVMTVPNAVQASSSAQVIKQQGNWDVWMPSTSTARFTSTNTFADDQNKVMSLMIPLSEAWRCHLCWSSDPLAARVRTSIGLMWAVASGCCPQCRCWNWKCRRKYQASVSTRCSCPVCYR